jgi:tight adherence protein C
VLFVLAVLVLATAAFFAAEAVTLQARQRTLALRRAVRYGRLQRAAQRDHEPFRKRVLAPAEHRLARMALKLDPRVSVAAVTSKLLAAGVSRSITPQQFLAGKAAAGLGGLVFGMFLGVVGGGVGRVLFFGLGLGGGAFFFPDLLLKAKASRRREEIRADLPDALDLLTVSVEAGLGFDGALAKLADHTRGPLADEFSLTLGQMRIGESRQEALKALAERVDAPEVAAFVRAIVQSDQLGMSLGRLLRTQAIDARDRRQAAAEERAMKAPVKMLFPTVLCIFPALFIIILAPAVMSLMEAL